MPSAPSALPAGFPAYSTRPTTSLPVTFCLYRVCTSSSMCHSASRRSPAASADMARRRAKCRQYPGICELTGGAAPVLDIQISESVSGHCPSYSHPILVSMSTPTALSTSRSREILVPKDASCMSLSASGKLGDSFGCACTSVRGTISKALMHEAMHCASPIPCKPMFLCLGTQPLNSSVSIRQKLFRSRLLRV